MGQDFRVGLITGVVLAGAALVWVATRPSLSPKPRAPQSAPFTPETTELPKPSLPWENIDAVEADNSKTPLASPLSTQAGDSRPVPNDPIPDLPAENHANAGAGPVAPPVAVAQPDYTIYERSEPIETTRFHIVRKGDTLSSIAAQYYGSANQWQKIVAANSKTLKNPNKIAPGTKLIIPD